MEGLLQLIVPFVTLSILSVLIDKLMTTIEFIIHKIPKLPDMFEPAIAYVCVLAISILICYFASFDIFIYLDLEFPNKIGVYLTGIMVSQGSHYIRSSFDTINGMPSIFSGVFSSIKSLFK